MSQTDFLQLLANASETGFEELTLVEPATFNLQLDANATKKDAVFVKGRVQDGPYQGKLIGCGQLSFTEKATSIAVQNLVAMGISKEQLNALGQQFPGNMPEIAKAIASLVKDRIVVAEIVYNTMPNGEVRNQFAIGKIKLVSAPPPPAIGGVPTGAVPAPAAAEPTPAPAAAATPAPEPVAAPVAEVPAPAPAAAPAETPAPVAAVAAPAAAAVTAPPGDDPGF